MPSSIESTRLFHRQISLEKFLYRHWLFGLENYLLAQENGTYVDVDRYFGGINNTLKNCPDVC